MIAVKLVTGAGIGSDPDEKLQESDRQDNKKKPNLIARLKIELCRSTSVPKNYVRFLYQS